MPAPPLLQIATGNVGQNNLIYDHTTLDPTIDNDNERCRRLGLNHQQTSET